MAKKKVFLSVEKKTFKNPKNFKTGRIVKRGIRWKFGHDNWGRKSSRTWKRQRYIPRSPSDSFRCNKITQEGRQRSLMPCIITLDKYSALNPLDQSFRSHTFRRVFHFQKLKTEHRRLHSLPTFPYLIYSLSGINKQMNIDSKRIFNKARIWWTHGQYEEERHANHRRGTPCSEYLKWSNRP